MLLADFIKDGTADLETLYPREEAHSLVVSLCCHFLGTKSYTHLVDPHFEIAPAKLPALDDAMTRLCAGEPIQHIEGFAEFCERPFKVNRDVLIPRPETEALVKEASKEAARLMRERAAYGSGATPVRVLDLCTGSGCIAWSVALGVPGVEVVAVDVSRPALDIAESQTFDHEIKDMGALEPLFIQADVLDVEQAAGMGEFDVLVSNPPYVRPSEKAQMRRNVLDYEPALALFVPEDDPLVFYRAVAGWAMRVLVPGGKGMVEINEALGDGVAALFKAAGLRSIEKRRDFFEKTRYVFFEK